MALTRRTVLASGIGAAAGLALSSGLNPALGAARRPGRAKGLKILILGGTSLTGPQIINAARKNGHTITVFNRGRTEKRKGSVGEDVERLLGDRDPKVGDGLKALEGDRAWDVVVDNSGFYPRHARATAELLSKRAKRYIFVSTISVYQQGMPPNSDESAALATMPDPTSEDMAGGLYYGALKALCEQEVQKIYGEHATIIRPGLIVGPGDDTDRFTYWPVRVSKGGEVLAPHAPTEPVQWIDCRDLGEWIVHVAEQEISGTFNAVGPDGGPTMGKLLDASKAASKSDATFTWVPTEFLGEQGVSPWSDMPCWVPSIEPTLAGMSQTSAAKGVAKGLKFRTIEQTVADTLEWWPKELERRRRVTKEMIETAKKDGKEPPKLGDPEVLRAGIKPEREKSVLAAWKAKQEGK